MKLVTRRFAVNARRGHLHLPRILWRPRATLALGLMLLLASILAGCAAPARRPTAARVNGSQMSTGSPQFVEWQQDLGEYLMRAGAFDPAVLSQLPLLRSPATLRPGRIIFAATDIDAVVPERDGYDVFGLLVDKRPDPAGAWYIFIIGTIERRDFRPAVVTDVRAAAMAFRSGHVVWETGPDDPPALARYRQRADAAAVLRFPTDHDEFRILPCDAGICVEETGSGARWSIGLAARAAATPSAGSPAQAGPTGGS